MSNPFVEPHFIDQSKVPAYFIAICAGLSNQFSIVQRSMFSSCRTFSVRRLWWPWSFFHIICAITGNANSVGRPVNPAMISWLICYMTTVFFESVLTRNSPNSISAILSVIYKVRRFRRSLDQFVYRYVTNSLHNNCLFQIIFDLQLSEISFWNSFCPLYTNRDLQQPSPYVLQVRKVQTTSQRIQENEIH